MWVVLYPLGSTDHYAADPKAFLFSLVNKPGWAPVKLPQRKDPRVPNIAVLQGPNQGPTFGTGYDLQIDESNRKQGNSNSYTDLGATYTPPNGYSYRSTFARTFLHGGSGMDFIPDEVEMFYETT